MNRRRFVLSTTAALVAAAVTPAGAATPTDLSFPASPGSLAYRRFGTGGPIDILLAGGPGIDASYLDPVAQQLANGRTEIVFDQRGTGGSRAAFTSGATMTVAGSVSDVDALRVHLGLERLALIGHSWGSMLAMAYAAAHPERVASLALLDPGGPNPDFGRDFERRIHARLTADDLAAEKAADAAGTTNLQAILPGYFFGHAAGLAYAKNGALVVHENVGSALWPDIAKHYDVTAALRGTTIPTLIVYGSVDPSLAAKPALDALFPHATVVTIPDAGHFPWLENPAPFYAALTAFENGVGR
jgi:pimeloyl-ACP methyl ester carboxylesterase